VKYIFFLKGGYIFDRNIVCVISLFALYYNIHSTMDLNCLST